MGGLGVCLFLQVRYGYSWFFVLVPIVLWLFITVLGSFNIRMNYHVRGFHQKRNLNDKLMALTFDDGPTAFTSSILDLLAQHKQKATFFCIGKQIEEHPDIFKRIISEGHGVGNHTFSHTTKMGFFGKEEVVEEIETANAIIKKTGDINTPFFRPPFGVTNPSIAFAVKHTGMRLVGWNVRSYDTVTSSETKILIRVLKGIKPGCVVLLHDTSEKTVNVTKALLAVLSKGEYKSVPVDILINSN